MITGELKPKVDRVWDAFWAGGISNPLEVMEQITYLLFIRRLDDLHRLEENKANRLKQPMQRRIFPEGKDPKDRPYEDLRWSRFKNLSSEEMFEVVGTHVFPFLQTLGGDDSTYSHHMRDARFTIPTAALLTKARTPEATTVCPRRAPADAEARFSTATAAVRTAVLDPKPISATMGASSESSASSNGCSASSPLATVPGDPASASASFEAYIVTSLHTDGSSPALNR